MRALKNLVAKSAQASVKKRQQGAKRHLPFQRARLILA